MPGNGPAPKDNRQNPRDVPQRGEWTAAPGVGWQHGDIPKPPSGLRAVSRETWETWFRAWFAAHWTQDDLPILRQIIKLYDKADRDEASAAELTQFRQLLDSYGITPKGQQDRRWKRPADEAPTPALPESTSRYGHLRAVGD